MSTLIDDHSKNLDIKVSPRKQIQSNAFNDAYQIPKKHISKRKLGALTKAIAGTKKLDDLGMLTT